MPESWHMDWTSIQNSSMKILMVVRTLTLSFMVVVIFSFNNVPGNNSNIVHNKSGSPAEKESAVKKDLPVSIKTGVQKNGLLMLLQLKLNLV